MLDRHLEALPLFVAWNNAFRSWIRASGRSSEVSWMFVTDTEMSDWVVVDCRSSLKLRRFSVERVGWASPLRSSCKDKFGVFFSINDSIFGYN